MTDNHPLENRDPMLLDLINLAIGLAAGIVTGFYFERRSSRSSREQHEATLQSNLLLQNHIKELELELQTHQGDLKQRVNRMQESIYSTATTQTSSSRSAVPSLDQDSVLEEIRNRVGPDGTTSLSSIQAHFASQGFAWTALELVLNNLVNDQKISRNGKQVSLS